MIYFVLTILLLGFGFVENTEIIKSVNRGDTVTLSCQRNSSLMTTRWRRNNEIVSEGFKVNPLLSGYERYVIDNGKDFREYNLQIMNTSDIDQGNYTCEMQLQYKVIQTKYFVMLNESSDSTFRDDVSTQQSLKNSITSVAMVTATVENTGVEGEIHFYIVLLCVGIPALGVIGAVGLFVFCIRRRTMKRRKRYYNKVLTQDNEEFELAHLTKGYYNKVLTQDNEEFELAPLTKEHFTKALDTLPCIEGESVAFEYEVRDNNQTAMWFKDGTKVSTSDKYKEERHGRLHRLVVNNTNLDDAGEYSVRIKNFVRHYKLIVLEYFTKTLYTHACIEGESVHFECEVLDDNQTALWFKDGIQVSTSDKYKVERHGRLHRLVVNKTKLDDKGEYSVRIKNCSRRSKLIVGYLPAAIRQLSEQDKGHYLEIIKSSTETRYYIKILIIGENGVGKTCLLRRLLGESIEDVESTDGIDIVHRCKIRVHGGQYGQWVIDTGKNKRKDIMTRINTTVNARTSENQQNHLGESRRDRQSETKTKGVQDKIEGTKISAPSTDDIDDKRQEKSYALSLPDNTIKKSVSESNQLKEQENKIVTGLEMILTKTILNELSQLINDEEKYYIRDEVLVDCGFWDFAGQRQYYPTHQVFLNPNAIYLLVAYITKDIKKINTEVGYDQIGEYIDFWFDNIHSCGAIENITDYNGEYLNPPVIVVCTGIDECKDKLNDRKNEFRAQLLDLLYHEEKLKHLRRICFISNTEPLEADLDYLRQSIFEFGKNIETFGEILPLRWIRLEQALDILCEAGVNILSWRDMADLAFEFSIQDENEVGLFLKYQHKIGSIIYFESLKEHVILNQKWLADAFRCFISDKYDEDLKLTQDWKTLEETGELKPSLIVKLFQKECKREFYKHESHILKVMEMFGIIVRLKTFINDQQQQSMCTYYMPCMISKKKSVEQIYDIFGVKGDQCTRTPWLCMQFDFMPFDFFNHIIFFYISKYPVCTEASSERMALYHGMGVFHLDNTQSRKFVLCFSKNTIAMQIWKWKKLEQGKYKSMREELESVIHNAKYKFEARRFSYIVKTKCANGDIHVAAGRKSHKELTDLKSSKYLCEEHMQMHDTLDFFQTWFEENSENSKGRSAVSAEKDTMIQENNQWRPLIEACSKGNMSAVQRLIEKGADYNASDSTGNTVFLWSCVGGNVNIIDLLIAKSCDIHKPNIRGKTPLMAACTNGHFSAVQRLIEKGADYNSVDSTGNTVVFWSSVGGIVDIIDLVTAKGCNIDKPNYRGKTPLMAACGKGHLSAVQHLIEMGANCNASDSKGQTVFYWSCVGGKIDLIDNLITKGCDIHKPNTDGQTPLMVVCSNRHFSAVQRLIECGADYNASDSTGNTVFFWSCVGGNVNIIDFLIAKGCDIHKPNNRGKTPLMAACSNGHLSAVQSLIEYGADFNARDSTGNTVVYWSRVGQNVDIEVFLKPMVVPDSETLVPH